MKLGIRREIEEIEVKVRGEKRKLAWGDTRSHVIRRH